jgi:hypothetical protein
MRLYKAQVRSVKAEAGRLGVSFSIGEDEFYRTTSPFSIIGNLLLVALIAYTQGAWMMVPPENQEERRYRPPDSQGKDPYFMPDKLGDVMQGTLNMLILKIVALGPIQEYGIAIRIEQMRASWYSTPSSIISIFPANTRPQTTSQPLIRAPNRFRHRK